MAALRWTDCHTFVSYFASFYLSYCCDMVNGLNPGVSDSVTTKESNQNHDHKHKHHHLTKTLHVTLKSF